MRVARLLPIWIERGNFQNLRGPLTAIQCPMRMSLLDLRGCIFPDKREESHAIVPSYSRHTPCQSKRKSIMRVFGRLFHIFHKYTLKLFGSQCIPLYSFDLISINSPIYVTLYSFSFSSVNSSFPTYSPPGKCVVLFF